MDYTANLKLPYLAAAQAQKHVTHNEALQALDAVVQLSVEARNLADPPASPDEGSRYVVAPAGTGAWTGHAHDIAAFIDGAWKFFQPVAGWLAWVVPESKTIVWNGTAWTDWPTATSVNPTPLVGVNTTADPTNRIAVKSDASLFSHDDVTPGTGNHQMKVNKSASNRTASLLFQTGFSGRAEFGLTGDDNWHVKVSPDGATWHEALAVDRTNGRVSFPQAPAPANVLFNLLDNGGRFGASPEPQTFVIGTYALPSWLSSYNGSALAQGDKFTFDNSTYGGAAAALGTDVHGLIEKIKDTIADPTTGRYGIEFYLVNITAGTGTSAVNVVAGGVTHYLALLNGVLPTWQKTTIGYNIKVKSGSMAVYYDSSVDTYVDGVLISAPVRLQPADGWKQVVRRLNVDPRRNYGYDTNVFRVYATAGSVMAFGLPFLFPGWAPVSSTPIGVVPSLRTWR
ncbi:MAG: DUF2793 domain-containing protein [Hyphomicrobiaceae bacterium]